MMKEWTKVRIRQSSFNGKKPEDLIEKSKSSLTRYANQTGVVVAMLNDVERVAFRDSGEGLTTRYCTGRFRITQ